MQMPQTKSSLLTLLKKVAIVLVFIFPVAINALSLAISYRYGNGGAIYSENPCRYDNPTSAGDQRYSDACIDYHFDLLVRRIAPPLAGMTILGTCLYFSVVALLTAGRESKLPRRALMFALLLSVVQIVFGL